MLVKRNPVFSNIFDDLLRDLSIESTNDKKYALPAVNIKVSENELLNIMKKVPAHIDMSSLPQIDDDKRITVISIASYDKNETIKYFSLFTEFLDTNSVKYTLDDI